MIDEQFHCGIEDQQKQAQTRRRDEIDAISMTIVTGPRAGRFFGTRLGQPDLPRPRSSIRQRLLNPLTRKSKDWFIPRKLATVIIGAQKPAGETQFVEYDINGVVFSVETQGSGRDILYLGASSWFANDNPFIARLSAHGRVIAPVAPGFGPGPVDRRSTTVDDLAYLYLDLIERMKLSNILLVGASFGGWVAAEMAIKTCERISAIALIDPLGVKIGDRLTRDIADFYGLPDAELRARAYVDPSIFVSDVKAISDEELARRMRARESLARYGWSPFMHDPKLAQRLHRVTAPTQFIWGARDAIVSPAYGRAYAALVPGSRFTEIAGAAHFPQIEQPAATLDAILSFAQANSRNEAA